MVGSEVPRLFPEDVTCIAVDAEQVAAKWGELVAITRTKIMGVPSKAKQRMPDLSADDAALLEEIVREALEDLAGG